ncbi:MAG: MFS transporter [Alphaproteobacteria bacterium TMED89]|nr:hypothetical protein [Rhodospirillaceae bacterium]RPH13283.1 MAG: MFS transporter [Alphaproteobacteria bacterium TMED89]
MAALRKLAWRQGYFTRKAQGMLQFDPLSPNALRHPLYLQWTVGFVIGSIGLWMTRLTLGYVVWELTQSPALTGLTAFLILALPAVMGPFLGVWIENLNPKRVIVVVQFLNLWIYFALALIAFVGTSSVLPYLFASAAIGFVVAIWQPARLVMPTLLVPDAALGSAVAINSTLFNTARIIGPASAAWAIAFGGVTLAFFLGFVLYVIFFFAVLFLRVEPPAKSKATGSFADRFAGGLREAAKDPLILLAMAATTFSGFFVRAVVELMPAINGELIANGTAQTLGYLTSAAGIGAIFMGTVLATQRGTAAQMLGYLFVGGIVGGLAVCGMAVSASVWMLLLLSFVAGGAGTLTLIGSQASILQTAPKDFRTRIMALWGALAFGGMGIGSVASGALASLIGLPLTLSIFGLIGALGSGILWAYSKYSKVG